MSAESWDLIRIGVVSAVDAAACRASVTFEQLGWTSDPLPVVQQGAGASSSFWLPSIGDKVVCAFYSDGTEHGVVVGSYYPAGSPPPGGAGGKRFVVFPDGSHVTWDNGALSIEAKGDITIIGTISTTGDMVITGDVDVYGTVTADGFILRES